MDKKCSPWTLVSSDTSKRYADIFWGVQERTPGVMANADFSMPSVTISSKPLDIRHKLSLGHTFSIE